uniref:Transposase n=1 Tax=Knipowitschia caucasica TaxID=637954 RepID=A0AAV2M8G0_KNICA
MEKRKAQRDEPARKPSFHRSCTDCEGTACSLEIKDDQVISGGSFAYLTPPQRRMWFQRISYQDSNYRRSIPAEERLSICLRFLATGDSYRTIAGSFRAGISTVSMLIPDVVAAIWDCLVEEFMAVPGAEEWR